LSREVTALEQREAPHARNVCHLFKSGSADCFVANWESRKSERRRCGRSSATCVCSVPRERARTMQSAISMRRTRRLNRR